MRARRWLLVGVAVLAASWISSGVTAAGAATCTKTAKTGGGTWSSASTWVENAVPTAADYVCLAAGTATVTITTNPGSIKGLRNDANLSINSGNTLTLSDAAGTSPSELSGALEGGGGVIVAAPSTLAVNHGTMTGSGTTTIASGATMTVTDLTDAQNGLYLNGGRQVVNNGTLTVTGSATGHGELYLEGFGNEMLTSNGLLDLRESADIRSSATSAKVVIAAAGELRSSTGGVHTVGVPLFVAGKVSSTDGTVDVISKIMPATGTTTGVVTTAGGTVLLHEVESLSNELLSTQGTGVHLDFNSTVRGSGGFTVASGTLTVDRADMTSSGTTTVAAGASMVVSDSQDLYHGLYLNGGRKLVNNGTVTLTGTPGDNGGLYLEGFGNELFTNAGTLNLDADVNIGSSSSAQLLANTATGTIVKRTGNGTSIVNVSIDNDGTITSTVGELALVGNGSPTASTGSFTAAPDARTAVSGVVLGNGSTLAGPTAPGTGTVALRGATVPSGATATATGRTVMEGGTLGGAGTFTVASGTMAVDAGTMSGPGTTTVAPGAAMTITSVAGNDYGLYLNSGRAFVDSGTVTVTGVDPESPLYGGLYLEGFGNESFTVNGTLNLANGAHIWSSSSGQLLSIGATGSLVKTTGSGTSALQVRLENDGTVSTTEGTLVINSSSNPPTSSGTFSAGPNGTTSVAGIQTTGGASFAGPTAPGTGSVVIESLTLASGTATTSGRTTIGGQPSGPGGLTIASGTTTADGGAMGGVGTTTVASGATLAVVDTSNSTIGLTLLGGRQLVNNGTITVTGNPETSAGDLFFEGFGNELLTNNGVLDLRGGAQLYRSGGSALLRNAAAGVITSTTADVQEITLPMQLAGQINPSAGTLRITGAMSTVAGSTTGLITTTGSGLVHLQNTTTIGTGEQITTQGTGVWLHNGAVNGAGALRIASGTLTSSNGSMGGVGTTTVAAGATLLLTDDLGGSGLGLGSGRQLVNDGQMTVQRPNGTGGYALFFDGFSNEKLTNNGVLELRDDADVQRSGSSATIVNSATGTITKTSGTDESAFGISVDNSGTVATTTGRLYFNAGFLAQVGPALTKGTYRVTAPGSLRLPGGTITSNQATIELSGSGSDFLDGSAVDALNLSSNSGSLTVRGGRSLGTPGAFTNSGNVGVGTGSGSSLLQVNGTYTQSGAAAVTTADTSGSITSSGAMSITGGKLRGRGTLVPTGGLAVTGTTRVEPGVNGVGTLSVTGAASLAATTTFAVDVNGATAALADRLAVSGAGTLAGTLDIATGYTPARNDDLTVITCGTSCSGTFGTVNGTTVPTTATWKAEYKPSPTANTVHLRAVSPLVSVANASKVEGNSGTSNLSFTVSLDEPAVAPSTVLATTAAGTATTSGPRVSDTDYTAVATTVSFAIGESSKTVLVPIVGDVVYENNEAFALSIATPVRITLQAGSTTATGTITNDDAVPTLSVGDVSKTEGSASSSVTVPVTLSGPSALPVTAAWTTANGTATAPGDYAAASGTVTFPAEVVSQNVSTTVVGDAIPEVNETFNVNLSSPTVATIADGTGVVTIVNDDTPTASVANASKAEGNSGTSNLTFTITLDNPAATAGSVTASTSNGTATTAGAKVSDVDYTATSVSVPFAAGESSKTVSVPIVGDGVFEPNETFTLTLSSPSNLLLGTSTATGTITNDEAVPTLAVGDVTKVEGSANSAANVPVTLSGPSSTNVTATYGTADGTATQPSDYLTATGTVTFLPEVTSQNLAVTVVGDTAPEPNEQFTLNLSAPVGATIGTGTGTVTITNDDGGQGYVGVTPFRICDTRTVSGTSPANQCNTGPGAGKLGPGGQRDVQVTGLGGVPSSGVTAVVLNLAETNNSAPSFLTVFPQGTARPNAANLNWALGRTVSNLVQVPVSPTGQISVWNSVGQVDVILDIQGYVTARPSGVNVFNPLTPSRICDSRAVSGSTTVANQCNNNGAGTGILGVNGTRNIQITGQGGVPASGVSAVVLNVAATSTTANSFFTVYPAGQALPNAANVNWFAGQTTSNRVIVPVGANGQITVRNNIGAVNVIIDVNGWFSDASNPNQTGSYYTAINPTRICDSRAAGGTIAANQCNGNGAAAAPIGAGQTKVVSITGLGPVVVPVGATAVVLNVAVTGTTANSFLIAYPHGAVRPNTADLNWASNQTVSNLVVVKLPADGKIDLWQNLGSAHVVIDVQGYYSE